ncbi:MAG: aldehyde dehydrogenase family protein [Deltaproteobacteria bacterium]|jgi:betaine-aldehyde dehydrogenase|nr:aldehyde dehydrogenase family protein [Deltaproteobacteria bacterium]MBW2531821.1 aldehyde dehydrogenase family protein [Deltaproteobacteria bacterium]
MSRQAMYIGGAWVEARSGATRPILNPFDASVVAEVPEGGREDAAAAIVAAREAFDGGPWPEWPASERAALLCRIADRIAEHREELARLETLDTGKTLEESRWDLDDVVGVFRFYADLALEPFEAELDSPNPDTRSRLRREPVGVCAQICPWNYPLLQASWKVAPALATGCTIVLKPSELTPLTTMRLAELVEQEQVPPGVLNVVLGPGATVGAELSEHRAVDLVSFTGGVTTGKAIMRAASATVKRIALELGGKNPHIVFADADFDVAVDYALSGVFFHAGQICSAGARLMVQEPIHDRFVEALAARIASIRLGSGLDEATRMGPLISAEHRAKVDGYVAGARQSPARLVAGGRIPSESRLAAGFFYEPTLITECDASMAIVRDEVFGPVLTVERFRTEQEVVDRANDTSYGLSAGVWTRDEERIERVGRALRFGTVWVNDFNVYFAAAPWGGYKQSGLGRELGRAGLDEYLELKHLYRNHDTKALGWF